MMLKNTFIELLLNYSKDRQVIELLWTEIEKHHTQKNRHYHNLDHLEALLIQLAEVKSQIKNWDAILFCLFYHDIIYNSLKSDNEEKSADFARMELSKINLDQSLIDEICSHILASKSHTIDTNSDTNYFTDADLSILGQEWNIYQMYFENVRKEYAIYPDIIYKPGRKKVLKHFLEMNRIFKTDYFNNKLEQVARANIQKEINTL